MKVLHVINTLSIGGAEKLLSDSIPYYEDELSQVDVVILKKTNPSFFSSLTTKSKGKVLIAGNRWLYNPYNIWKLRKYLLNYDLVHVHLFPALYWVALSKLFFRIPAVLVFTEHSTENRRIRNICFRAVDQMIYSVYSAVVSITPAVQIQIIHKLRLKKTICRVVYNGIDVRKIKSATAYDKLDYFEDPEARILIQVARFQEAKDQRTVIEALKLLPKWVKLIFVGDGELKLECIELCEKLGLKDRILFLGIRMDVPELLAMSDIVIQSSHFEGFGLAAVEGMSAFKPVVASEVPGLKEVVEGAGLIFRKGDSQQLAKLVIELLEEPKKYQEVAEACYNRSKKFQISTMVKQYKAIYEEVLRDKRIRKKHKVN